MQTLKRSHLVPLLYGMVVSPKGLRLKARAGSVRVWGRALSMARAMTVKMTGRRSCTSVMMRFRQKWMAFFTSNPRSRDSSRDTPVTFL